MVNLLNRRRLLMQKAQEQGTDYSDQYFTITNVSGNGDEIGIVSPLEPSIKYRINGGSWITAVYTDSECTIPCTAGDSIEFSYVGRISTSSTDYTSFDISWSDEGLYTVSGNILSLVYGDNFRNYTTLPSDYTYNFTYMFSYQESIDIDASNLILPSNVTSYCYSSMFRQSGLIAAPALPATSLTERCYSQMFQNCTRLTTAPDLPASVLMNRCYHAMFRYCSNLNYVKAMFISTPGTNYTNNWLGDVAANGTFIKSRQANWNVSGASGIPSGWTVTTE